VKVDLAKKVDELMKKREGLVAQLNHVQGQIDAIVEIASESNKEKVKEEIATNGE